MVPWFLRAAVFFSSMSLLTKQLSVSDLFHRWRRPYMPLALLSCDTLTSSRLPASFFIRKLDGSLKNLLTDTFRFISLRQNSDLHQRQHADTLDRLFSYSHLDRHIQQPSKKGLPRSCILYFKRDKGGEWFIAAESHITSLQVVF